MGLKIAYFGLPLGALRLSSAGFVPGIICLGHPEAIGGRRVRRTLSARALILGKPDLEAAPIQETLRSYGPDVLLSWFWPKRIPAQILRLAPRGAFGTHPSLLPLWRGPDPYFWSIYAGDRETGVSLHRLETDYDTGAVIAQRRVTIAPSDTAWSLAKKLDRPALALLVECAERLESGELLLGESQDDAAAIEAPQPDDDVLSIVWKRPVAAILRLVRAAAPEPGAHAQLGDHDVDVLRARRFGGTLPTPLRPADAIMCPDGVVIAAKDGGILIEKVRLEDGTLLEGQSVARLFAQPLQEIAAG